jgi:Tol biopolymer transport system component
MLSTEIVRVSVSNASVQGNSLSTFPSISADGRYVTFKTQASNLVSFATTGTQIIVRDIQTGQNTLVSVTPDGLDDGNGASNDPHISDDGRFIVFSSQATNLNTGNPTGSLDIFLRDLQTNVTTQVNMTNTGAQPPNNVGASTPAISPDGGFVAFLTSAPLITGAGSDTLYLANNVFLPNPSPFSAVAEPYYFDALPATLTWNAVSWAEEYEVQVADNSGFNSATSYFAAAGVLNYDLTPPENGTYYWRVRARNIANVWGSWSAPQMFEVEVE